MTKAQSLSCLQKRGKYLIKHALAHRSIQKDIAEYQASIADTSQPSAFHLSTLLCLFCILGGLAVDYFLLRAVIEYLASLSSHNLAYLAVWIIPILIVGAEVWIAVEKVKTKQNQENNKEKLASFKRHDSFWNRLIHHPMLKWHLLSLLILAIQPASALATYYVLEKLNPEIHFSNVCLCIFSLILALAFHIAILNSGEQLLILEDDIKRLFRSRKLSGLTKASMRAQERIVTGYQEYTLMLHEYEEEYQGDISRLELPPVVSQEIKIIYLQHSVEELQLPLRIETPSNDLKVHQPDSSYSGLMNNSPYPPAPTNEPSPDSWGKPEIDKDRS